MASNYLNPQSEEARLRCALKLQIAKITKVNGYNCDVGTIYDDYPADVQRMVNLSVVPLMGYERTSRYDNNMLIIESRAFLLINVNKGEWPSITEAIERIKEDVQYVIGNFWMLPDADNVPSCQVCTYLSSEPYGKLPDAGVNGSGVKIGLRIYYQQTILDPSQN